MVGLLLETIDGWLSFLPVWCRVTLWGTFLGSATMGVYGLFAPQEELAELKERTQKAREDLQSYDGTDPGVLWSKMKKTFALSFDQMKLMFGPTMMAGIPVVLVLVWMELAYAHRFPEPGEEIRVETVAAESADEPELRWEPASAVEATDDGNRVQWPGAGESVTLLEGTKSGGSATELVSFPLPAARTRVGQPNWTHWIFANPAGYLPESSDVRRVELELPRRMVLPWGPDWMRTWHPLFLVVITVAAGGVKVGFGIE